MLTDRRPVLSACLALASLLPVANAYPQFLYVDPTADPVDSEMRNYARIDWDDPLNPRYVNLGDDHFMLDTQSGVRLWKVATNTFADPPFAPVLGNTALNKLDYGAKTWARLGNSPAGTAFVGVGGPGEPHTLFWWDSARRQIAAALPFNGNDRPPALLSVGPSHLLLCWRDKDSKVVHLDQSAQPPRLEWAAPGDSLAQVALRATGVVETVSGFVPLSEQEVDRPLFYDATQCGWIMKARSETVSRVMGQPKRLTLPRIKPYFLKDGRILVSEAEGALHVNPPQLWHPDTRKWVDIESTYGRGGEMHSAGSEEPVLSHTWQAPFVQFLDTGTLRWLRSRQRLPEAFDLNVEPLSNGSALVLMRHSEGGATGQAGLVAPITGGMPPGRLSLDRYDDDGEIALHDGGLLLVGDRDGETSQSEIIDVGSGIARTIASLPVALVTPHGLALKDGSVLVFGGTVQFCSRNGYASNQCRNNSAQPTFLYHPKDDRWQAVPGLNIRFTVGYRWDEKERYMPYQWARNDAIVRRNGDVVWIEGDANHLDSGDQIYPQKSVLTRWSPKHPDVLADDVAVLRKARTRATLIELADGRLAVMGGKAQLERVALDKNGLDCPDELVSIGPLRAARGTEILDESVPGKPVWRAGPLAHYSGGRAVLLGNGRILKMSYVNEEDDGYRAEIADAAFSAWEKLPPIPLSGASVRNIGVVGNRVVVYTNKDRTVAWDDDARTWRVWPIWPTGAGNERDPPISITGLPDGKRALIRYRASFEILPLPER